jgi:hypothetical protein
MGTEVYGMPGLCNRRSCRRGSLSNCDGPTAIFTKNRRIEGKQGRPSAGATAPAGHVTAVSAAAGLAAGAQAVRESKIQAALNREPFVSEILWLPDARSAWRRTRTVASPLDYVRDALSEVEGRIFESSDLRRIPSVRAAIHVNQVPP